MAGELAYPIEPLVRALQQYDATQAERNLLWDCAQTNEDVLYAEKQEEEALRLVRHAFWEVTKDRNSYNNCMCVDLGFCRKLVAQQS